LGEIDPHPGKSQPVFHHFVLSCFLFFAVVVFIFLHFNNNNNNNNNNLAFWPQQVGVG
jgi:hypothetical protein